MDEIYIEKLDYSGRISLETILDFIPLDPKRKTFTKDYETAEGFDDITELPEGQQSENVRLSIDATGYFSLSGVCDEDTHDSLKTMFEESFSAGTLYRFHNGKRNKTGGGTDYIVKILSYEGDWMKGSYWIAFQMKLSTED